MKLIRNTGLLIFLMAKAASFWILSVDFMNLTVSSLQVSTNTLNSISSFGGNVSYSWLTIPSKYFPFTSSCTSKRLKRCIPCRITVVVWSGISNILTIFATVPTEYKSSKSGRSTSAFIWHTVPIVLLFLYAWSISFKDDFLPTATGSTTPGKRTILRNGNIGKHLSILPSKSCSSSPSISAIKENAVSRSVFSSKSLNLLFIIFYHVKFS